MFKSDLEDKLVHNGFEHGNFAKLRRSHIEKLSKRNLENTTPPSSYVEKITAHLKPESMDTNPEGEEKNTVLFKNYEEEEEELLSAYDKLSPDDRQLLRKRLSEQFSFGNSSDPLPRKF